MSVKLSDLAKLPEAEQNEILDELVKRTREPLNGYEDRLRERIASYERRYETRSDRLIKLLSTRQWQETWDMVPWLMAIRELEDLESKTRPG